MQTFTFGKYVLEAALGGFFSHLLGVEQFLPIAQPMIQAEPNIFPWRKSFGENYQIEVCCLSPSLHPIQDFI